MKKFLLVLAICLFPSLALAQGNPTCPTRPIGDNSNACASTAFVYNSGGGIIGGVVCDGNPSRAASNLVGIQTAINAAPKNGVVVLPEGICYVSDSIIKTGGSLNLTGQGHGTVLKLLSSSPHASILNLSNLTSLELYNFSLDGSNVNGDGSPTVLVSVSSNITFSGIRVFSAYSIACGLESVTRVNLYGIKCEMDTAIGTRNQEGLTISSTISLSSNINIFGPYFKNAGAQINGTDVHIYGGECDHWAFGACIGFGGDPTFKGNTVDGMWMHDGSGIDVNGTVVACAESVSDNTVFTNNLCERTSGGGFTFFGQNNKSTNNTVIDCGRLPSGLIGTSTTSMTITSPPYSQSLTTQASLAFTVGQSLAIYQTSNAGNLLAGTVTLYNSGTGALVVAVAAVTGSGTISAWTIAPLGYQPVGFLGVNSGGLSTAVNLQVKNNTTGDTGGGTCKYGYGEYAFGTVVGAVVEDNKVFGSTLSFSPTTSRTPIAAGTRYVAWLTPSNAIGYGALFMIGGELDSGLLIPGYGGTGAASLTAHGVLLGEGTSAFVATTPGTDGQVLQGHTSADPSFGTPTVALGGITGLGTGIATALAIPVGSVGSPAIFNGNPTVQIFTSSTGTYTKPANVSWIKVTMVGGGGGGGGSGTAAGGTGGTGGNTTFGTTLLAANGGTGGPSGNGTSTGGTASLGSGPIGTALSGGTGGSGTPAALAANAFPQSGAGCSSPFGGAPGGAVNGIGGNAVANTGSGGAGGGGTSALAVMSGSGGACGGYVNAIINSPSATYGYVVGATGTAGTAGTSGVAGGAGGSGYIVVEEHYGP